MSYQTATMKSMAGLDVHDERSRKAQWQADKWMMSGALFLGSAVFGIIGLPLFLRGLALQLKAQKAGLTVRPMMVTLIGYLVAVDAALNSIGWALDMVAHHTLLARVFLMA